MKTLFLHIGTPKTGTTSIQYFCYENRKVLEKHGFHYPVFPYHYPRKSHKRNGLFLESAVVDENGVIQEEEEKRRFTEGMETVKNLFQKFDNIIISNEGVWNAVTRRKGTLWKDLAQAAKDGGYTIKVIVYFRRQDELLDSWWNETVKHGISRSNVMPWEKYTVEYKKYFNLRYLEMLQNIEAELGAENIIIRRFNRKYFEGGILQADFLNVLGLKLTDEYSMEEVEQLNTRMSGNACEIKRIINGMKELSLPEKRYYESVLLEYSPISEKDYPAAMFSKEEAAAFVEKFAEENRQIEEKYVKDGKPLFSDKYKDKEKWQKDNPYMQDDLIRFITKTHLDLCRTVENQQKEIEKLNTRIYNLRHPFKAFTKKIKKWVKKMRKGKKK